MADITEAYKFNIPNLSRGPDYYYIWKTTPCYKCLSIKNNYCVTNDMGSVQGCTKCGTTFPASGKEWKYRTRKSCEN